MGRLRHDNATPNRDQLNIDLRSIVIESTPPGASNVAAVQNGINVGVV